MGNELIKLRRWHWWVIICAVLLNACQPVSTSPEQTSAAAQPPVEITRQTEPAPALSETSTIIEEKDICTESGQVKRYMLESELMNGSQYFSVYFPPCYDGNLQSGYPVLYLLHGQTFNDNMWFDLGAGEITDTLITSAVSRPFLMVMPYEEFHYRNPDKTNFPQALIEEIIPFIEDSFNVCRKRECRALGGISRGASWAVRLGLQHWQFFAAFGAHSLPTFNGDLNDLPEWLEAIPDNSAPRIYLDTGRFDPEVKTAYAFEQVLNQKGILHEWHLNDGRHDEEYWSAHMREYLEWYASVWVGEE